MSSAPVAAPSHRHMGRGDRRMFAASDDSTMLKQIQGTHAPDGREVDVRPILDVVEDVFRRATPTVHVFFYPFQALLLYLVVCLAGIPRDRLSEIRLLGPTIKV